MPEIPFQQLPALLDKKENLPPVWLIHGEDALVREALDALMAALLPKARQDMGYSPVDGAQADVAEALEQVNTFSLLGGKKVVAYLDARLFHSRNNASDLMEKALSLLRAGEEKKACRPYLSVLSVLGLSLEDATGKKGMQKLADTAADAGGPDGEATEAVRKLCDLCADQGMKVPAAASGPDLLAAAVEKGFPKGHFLVITADAVDRRQRVFKALAEAGAVIDCTVPRGSRKQDQDAREAVLRQRAAAFLEPLGKALEPAAFKALVDATGFDVSAFTDALERLAVFAGEKKRVTAKDVAGLVKRTRKDPIFELTSAVAKRDVPAALFYAKTMAADGIHPLAMLSALSNQVRKLAMAADFLDSPYGEHFSAAVKFPEFKAKILPKLEQYDAAFLSDAEAMDIRPAPRKGKPPGAELAIAGRGGHPYGIYQLLLDALGHSKTRLLQGLIHLSRADLTMKSAPVDPVRVLESVILKICR